MLIETVMVVRVEPWTFGVAPDGVIAICQDDRHARLSELRRQLAKTELQGARNGIRLTGTGPSAGGAA
jgi:hypothetical protein